MSTALGTWIAILGCSLTTPLTRGSFIAFAARLRLHPAVEEALRFAPAAALAAIVVPALVIRHGQTDLTPSNQHLMAACLAALVMWRTRSMMATLATGMALATLLRLYG